MENEKYPYLGYKEFEDGTMYIVLFSEEDTGTVVVNDTNFENFRVGLYGNFAEEEFKYLEAEKEVRLSNY